MALETGIMAAPDRAPKARDDQVEPCRQAGEDPSSLTGWHAGTAGGLVALALVLIAIPVAAAMDPPWLGQASRLLAGLAGLTPISLAARALVFVVALVVISRPDGTA